MRHQTHFVLCFAFALGCGGATASTTTETASSAEPQASATETASAAIASALAGAHRTEEQRARDRYRHPAETLAFFGLRSDMRVLEIQPGTAWYTAVLAPVLRDHGQLVITNGDPDAEGNQGRYARALVEALQRTPEVFERVETVRFAPPEQMNLGEPESFDMVLTFRSVHGWVRGGYDQQMFEAMARVLKPGGVLGLVEHRAEEGADAQAISETGYVPEAYVIQLAEAAGLRLEERSEINANPADTHDHPDGVWSLPPTLRGGDVDRDRFVEIGESDRMTLRFVKPAAE